MKGTESLTVAEILERPLFRHAKVVAGADGLDRPVRWVHVLEIMDGSSYVHGHEMILMTGVGLGRDKELKVKYIRELVESRVSALCIELVHRYVQLPREIIRFADEHRFPIIVFEKAVSFIGITQDIHAYLINRHHHQLLALERVSNQFLQLTLRPKGVTRILQLLHKEIQCPVWLHDHLGEDIAYPEQRPMPETASLIRQPIVALDVHVGDLYVDAGDEPPEFLKLVLDRAATAIAQEFLRRISLEERRLSEGRQWINDLISRGEAKLPSDLWSGIQAGQRLVIAAVDGRPLPSETGSSGLSDQEKSIAVLQWVRSASRLFGPLGFQTWMSSRGKDRVMVLLDRGGASPSRLTDRLREGFHRLFEELNTTPPASRYRWEVGVSHAFLRTEQAPQAWQQAALALTIPREEEAEEGKVICYDDLDSWQLFLQVPSSVLGGFVEMQLGALLDHDRKNGTQLVKTLEAFLNARQSKQQAAKDLFIHRQTLYYRLDQIASLLGEDWEHPSRRTALDMALAAHRFLTAREKGRP
ncbi:purine catabolism regulator [Melghirimyces profundicolus]|uniref:Purine catabolism regulator n=1 Tax=Melghirimyces profundicolus TaxID=1242148 RepID=A0A2T6C4W4_9BACL|nr:PucR family transcriptional regulator [Melghirimyces profundicolus]PTX63358.1 purine catabolism regulator [Melghirimyces profundicolus]